MQEHACNPENAPGSVVIPDRAPPKAPHGDNASDFSGFYVSGGEMRALHDLHAASAAKIQRASLPRHMASYIGRSRGAERKRLSWCSQTHRALGASKEPIPELSIVLHQGEEASLPAPPWTKCLRMYGQTTTSMCCLRCF